MWSVFVPNQSFDATILLEDPPKFEIRDGLVYITDVVGGLTIRRVMRPAAFEKSMRVAANIIADWRRNRADTVVKFPNAADFPDEFERDCLGEN